MGRGVRHRWWAAPAAAVLAAVLAVPAVAGAAGLSVAGPPPGPVPTPYQPLYARVAAQVAAFGALADRVPDRGPTAVGAELLAANGNIGPRLLTPAALSGVRTELAAEAALGVRGVTVDVSYPLLVPGRPGAAGYLRFYEAVARMVAARHLVLSVEENPVFSGTPLTPLSVSYAGLTLATYAASARRQAQVIVDDLHPAYLSILSEPDTFADTLGLPLDSPAGAVDVVRAELAGLARRHTAVGAGTGTWSDPAIDRALLARTSVDYLDLHVYPLGPAPLANLEADVAAAQAAHRPLVMDETWLNIPTATQASGPAGAPASLKVKSYSFWEPLDEQFVGAMVRYARGHGLRYVSFFDGARAFFAYLPWSPALQAAPYAAFTVAYNRAVGVSVELGEISGTGAALVRALGT